MRVQFNRLYEYAGANQQGANNPRRARVTNAYLSSMRNRGLWFFSDRNKGVGTGRFALSNG